MLLNILQYTGHPRNKENPTHNVSIAEVEKPSSKYIKHSRHLVFI